VGDAEFQKKCLGRMQEVSRGAGRTVLFVSHNMEAVQRLCTRAVLLGSGRIVAQGETSSVVAQYLARAETSSAAGSWIDLSSVQRTGSGVARVVKARYWCEEGPSGQPFPDGSLSVSLMIESEKACTIASLAVTLYDLQGAKLVNADTITCGRTLRLQPGAHQLTVRIAELHLNPGVYKMGFWLAGPLGVVFDFVPAGFDLEVVARQASGLGRAPADDGMITCRFEILGGDSESE